MKEDFPYSYKELKKIWSECVTPLPKDEVRLSEARRILLMAYLPFIKDCAKLLANKLSKKLFERDWRVRVKNIITEEEGTGLVFEAFVTRRQTCKILPHDEIPPVTPVYKPASIVVFLDLIHDKEEILKDVGTIIDDHVRALSSENEQRIQEIKSSLPDTYGPKARNVTTTIKDNDLAIIYAYSEFLLDRESKKILPKKELVKGGRWNKVKLDLKDLHGFVLDTKVRINEHTLDDRIAILLQFVDSKSRWRNINTPGHFRSAKPEDTKTISSEPFTFAAKPIREQVLSSKKTKTPNKKTTKGKR